jgi:AcrR family transcriptional regulator
VPRFVDHEQRKSDIVAATLDVLAEHGPRGLSFRTVAARMGGSTSLVTHYFPTQEALLDEVAATSLATWGAEIAALDEQTGSAMVRLQNLLLWLLPITDSGRSLERARINLLSGQILAGDSRVAFRTWDGRIRRIIAEHLQGLVPVDEVERAAELLRVVTNGIVLSAVEHPERWTLDRQIDSIDHVLTILGLPVERGSLDPAAVSSTFELAAPTA